MQDAPPLSTRPSVPDSAPASTAAHAVPGTVRARALVFDACEVGVVLRAVLFVELVLGVGAMYRAFSPGEWLAGLALLTGGALPATLLWLVVACSLKTALQRQGTVLQYLAGLLLGALAGAYACAMMALVGLSESPPWLASSASGALLAALLVAALVLRARGRTPAATTARLTELQSRIRPHFLFNTLNSAIALVRAEPERAEALLEDLSELFRHALVEQGESVTLAEEITLARRYLAIEQVRFGARLQVQWHLDPRTDCARLPPLLLQPLLENAVKHGVEPSPGGARLRVLTGLHGSRVLVRISNTLPPRDGQGGDGGANNGRNGNGNGAMRGHGIALANVRARLALLHDVQGGFSAGVQDGQYQVRITLPAAGIDARARRGPQPPPGAARRANPIPHPQATGQRP